MCTRHCADATSGQCTPGKCECKDGWHQAQTSSGDPEPETCYTCERDCAEEEPGDAARPSCGCKPGWHKHAATCGGEPCHHCSQYCREADSGHCNTAPSTCGCKDGWFRKTGLNTANETCFTCEQHCTSVPGKTTGRATCECKHGWHKYPTTCGSTKSPCYYCAQYCADVPDDWAAAGLRGVRPAQPGDSRAV